MPTTNISQGVGGFIFVALLVLFLSREGQHVKLGRLVRPPPPWMEGMFMIPL